MERRTLLIAGLLATGCGSGPTPGAPAHSSPPAAAVVEEAVSPETPGPGEIALELRPEPVFDVMLPLPPAAEALADPPPDTFLFLDPQTGWALSLERRGDGALHPAPDLSALALRAAKAQGAEQLGDVFPTTMGDVAGVQVDFRGGGANTSSCLAWRNGSVYVFGVTDPGGGEGVSELLRLLCTAVEFTSEAQAAKGIGPDLLAPLGVALPGARGLAVTVEGGLRITDVAGGYVTVFADFSKAESPYLGLNGTALYGRLESEGCRVVGSGTATVAGRTARRARCVLGDATRTEYAVLHVLETDAREWVVSVVSGDEDWSAAEAYADGLLAEGTLP